MYKLTPKRLEKAEHILNEHSERLFREKRTDTRALERQLKELWGVGYQEIKSIMLDIVKNHDDYKLLALYYMENSNGGRVTTEFHSTLADAYGISYFFSDERESAQAKFWNSAFSSAEQE